MHASVANATTQAMSQDSAHTSASRLRGKGSITIRTNESCALEA
jgi:hypothetical protein